MTEEVKTNEILGEVVQVIGPVVDVSFPANKLPNINDALEILDTPNDRVLIVEEIGRASCRERV